MSANSASSSNQQQTTHVDAMRRKRLAQLKSTNLVLDPSSTSHRCVVTHPGLPPDAVDESGNPSIIGLVWVARSARQMAMKSPGQDGRYFLEMDKLIADRLSFMAAAQYNIQRCAYDPEEIKYPLHVLIEIGHVGRTSFSVTTTVTLPSGNVMMTVVNQMVLIDPCTRRPTPVPDYWREQYVPLCVRQKPLIVAKQSPPEDIAISDLPHHTRVVVWSDTDSNNHTNFVSYIRYAMDLLMSALRKGKLNSSLVEAEVLSGLSEVKVVYLGESNEEDALHVYLWCPASQERTVVCSMTKGEEKPVCQVTMTFNEAEL